MIQSFKISKQQYIVHPSMDKLNDKQSTPKPSKQSPVIQNNEPTLQQLGITSKKINQTNVIILQKISNIVSAYYDNFNKLNLYYSQIESLIDYNKKLIQIFNQFEQQEEKLIKRLTKMEQINIEYMRQYCLAKGRQFKMPYLPEYKSIFNNFNLLDIDINCQMPEPPIIDVKYKDQLISILNQYFITKQDKLYQKIQQEINNQGYSKNHKKQLKKIQKLIQEYEQEMEGRKEKERTFDLLRKKSQIRRRVQQFYDSADKNVEIKPDYKAERKLIDKIINLHSKVQELNEELLQSYLKQEKDFISKFQKQRQQIHEKMQQKYIQVQQKYKQSQNINQILQQKYKQAKNSKQILQEKYKQFEKRLQSKYQQSEQKNHTLQQNYQQCQHHMQVLQQKYRQLENTNQGIQQKCKEFENRNQILQQKYQQYEAKLQQKNAQIRRFTVLIQLKCETITEYERILENNYQQIATLEQQVSNKAQNAQQVSSHNKNLSQQIKHKQSYIQKLLQQIKYLKQLSQPEPSSPNQSLLQKIRQLQQNICLLNQQILQIISQKQLKFQQSSKQIQIYKQKISIISNQYEKEAQKMESRIRAFVEENKKMEDRQIVVENLAIGVFQVLELVSSMSFNQKIKVKLEQIMQKLRQILSQYQKQMEWDIRRQSPGYFTDLSLDNIVVNSRIMGPPDTQQLKQNGNLGYSFDISNIQLIKQSRKKHKKDPSFMSQQNPHPHLQISRQPPKSQNQKQLSLNLSIQQNQNDQDYQSLRLLYQQAIQCLQMQQKKSKNMELEYQRFVEIILQKRKIDEEKYSLEKQVVFLTRLAQEQKQTIEEERKYYNQIFKQNIESFKSQMSEQVNTIRASMSNIR